MRARLAALLVSCFATPGMTQTSNIEPAVPGVRSSCSVQALSLQGISVSSAKLAAAASVGGEKVAAHCVIEGKFEQRTGAGGKAYAIAFQLRVPEAWNGRLIFQGGGGLNGAVGPAYGGVIGGSSVTGLARGFAVVSTDSGHQGSNADFAADQLAKLNYGYASIGKVVLVAKHLLERISGSRPERTYYLGCSNGGREAMMAAQRFPEEFDGVVAGSPAFNLGNAVLLARYSTSIYRDAAPKGPDGTPRLPLALLPADTKLLSDRILKQCDALDGMRDGFVFNQTACHFDPGILQCKHGQAGDQCLSPAKVRMIRKAFAGPVGRDGLPLVSHWTYDPGIDSNGWRMWQIGLMAGDKPFLTLPQLVDETLARYFNYPMLDPATLGQVDTAEMLPRIAPTSAQTNADSTQYSSFAAAGGKMLIVSGWGEPIFAPADLERWYRQLDGDTKAASGAPADRFARLYMVPGMNHCGGGPALDKFDALTALTDWVEKGKAPDQLIASGTAYPGVSRPICAYPGIATYRQGPKDEAASYACETPASASAE